MGKPVALSRREIDSIPKAPKRPLVPPGIGCIIILILLGVLPIIALAWHPIKWRILLSRLESEDESTALAAIDEMREYPAYEHLKVFFRVWSTTPSRTVAKNVEPDLSRGLPKYEFGLGKKYFLSLVLKDEHESFAQEVEAAYRTGNGDQRRRALFSLYIFRGRKIEDTLFRALDDEAMQVRFVARLCLVDIGTYEMLEEVLESLRGEEHAVIELARSSILGRNYGQFFPLLVAKLGAKAAEDREKAIELLKILTGTTLGFKAADPSEKRKAAIEKWEKYIEKPNEKSTLLEGQTGMSAPPKK
jgi:hypothetical protein